MRSFAAFTLALLSAGPLVADASCSSDCCSCITGLGGAACASRCTTCSDDCYQCVEYGGGTGCISDGRCDCSGGSDDGDDYSGDDGGGSGCSSMRSVTASELTCTFPQLSSSSASSYASAANSLLGGTLLSNKCEWAAFLANVGTESNGLTEWTQNPCNSATAAPYCGRGPLQLTGSTNYNYCSSDSYCSGCSGIVSDPEEVSSDTSIGFATAACVWGDLSGSSLSKYCDGTTTGLLETACYINAGHYPCGTPNGWTSRQDYW